MRKALWIFAAVLVLAQCGKSNPVAGPTLVGTYYLSSLSSKGATIILRPPSVTGSLSFSGNKYAESTVFATGDAINYSGSYTLSGSNINFMPNGEESYTGSVSAGNERIIVAHGEYTLVYLLS